MTWRSERPIEVACEQLCLFGRSLDLGRKNRGDFLKDLFFLEITGFRSEKPWKFRRRLGDLIIFCTTKQHFLRLFWTSQNHNSVTFELSPGPRSALGAPGFTLSLLVAER